METQYVYLLQTREFFNSKQPVYKIGRTKKHNLTRFSQYTLGSVLLFQSSCRDCYKLEREIITLFKQKYIHKHLIGRESFEGNVDEMVRDLCDIIKYERETPVLIVNNIESTQEVVVEENDGNEVIQVDIENNIINAFVEECIQDVVEENIPDVVVEDILDVVEEECVQDVVENEIIQASNEEIDIIIEDNDNDVIEDVENDNVIIEDVGSEDIVICQEVRSEFTVNNVKGRFICKICHFDTDTNGQLKQHSHTQKHMKNLENKDDVISPYKCGKCERGYQTKSGLQKHKLVCKAPEVASPEAVVPITPELGNIDLQTKIDNLERVIGKLTSLVENKLT